MPPLTVIVTTYNRLDYTRQTINSLFCTVPDAKIIVYDNHSTEVELKQYLTGLAIDGHIELILGAFNHGWAHSINESLPKVQTEYVLISNNDVVYNDGWYEKLLALYEKYPNIGIMGVWKHRDHGVLKDHGDMVEKGDMPAVGWLMKKSVVDDVGLIGEKGPCSTKGGNGEDSDYVQKVLAKRYLVCAPKDDVAVHIDGY